MAVAGLQAGPGPEPAQGQEVVSSFDFDPAFELGPLMSMRNLRPADVPVIPIFGGGSTTGTARPISAAATRA